VRLAIVSRHLPELEGTAAGRVLRATCDGIVADGHKLTAWSWGPEAPAEPLPSWCEWRPLPVETPFRRRAWALLRPRGDVGRAGWQPPDGAVAVADDPVSFAAVETSPSAVVTLHYSPWLDASALHRFTAALIQDVRAWRRACRRADLALAYSARVASAAGPRAITVPIAVTVPYEPVEPIDAPVAGLIANWSWPPNRDALARLLHVWPRVRSAVPGAELLLAGRGLDRATPGEGVEMIGPVARSADVLARVGLLLFPSPTTSGPKVKVLEAMAHGVPVLTTREGAEGIAATPGRDIAIATTRELELQVVALLRDPAERARLGKAGREAILAAHSPAVAARARIAALQHIGAPRL
jgi:glycosyltransferase involved in cell wall biosynthesis